METIPPLENAIYNLYMCQGVYPLSIQPFLFIEESLSPFGSLPQHKDSQMVNVYSELAS